MDKLWYEICEQRITSYGMKYANTGHDGGQVMSFIVAFHTTSLVRKITCTVSRSIQYETFQNKFANASSLGLFNQQTVRPFVGLLLHNNNEHIHPSQLKSIIATLIIWSNLTPANQKKKKQNRGRDQSKEVLWYNRYYKFLLLAKN